MTAVTAQVTAITDADFDAQVLASAVPVLVEFGAPWCGPCVQIAPILDRIAEERAGSLRIVTINNDEQPLTPTRYRVMGLPTLILFTGGVAVLELRGARPKTAIDRALDQALGTEATR